VISLADARYLYSSRCPWCCIISAITRNKTFSFSYVSFIWLVNFYGKFHWPRTVWPDNLGPQKWYGGLITRSPYPSVLVSLHLDPTRLCKAVILLHSYLDTTHWLVTCHWKNSTIVLAYDLDLAPPTWARSCIGPACIGMLATLLFSLLRWHCKAIMRLQCDSAPWSILFVIIIIFVNNNNHRKLLCVWSLNLLMSNECILRSRLTSSYIAITLFVYTNLRSPDITTKENNKRKTYCVNLNLYTVNQQCVSYSSVSGV